MIKCIIRQKFDLDGYAVKKIISLILSIVTLMFLSAPALAFTEESLSITVDTLSQEIPRGSQEVKVYVRVPAEPVWSAIDAIFTFDPHVLTFKSFVLNPELERQADEGEANIFAINKEHLSEGSIGIGFATASREGGYEGYYPAEYDYLGALTFSVNEDALLGFTAVKVIVRDINAVSGEESVPVPFTSQNGGFTVVCAHDWQLVDSKSVTCESDGFEKYVCWLCTAEEIYTFEATGHNWDKGVVIPPACEADGYTVYRCKNDPNHTVITEGEAAIGHSWIESVRVEPTCEENGYIEYICKNDSSHIKTENIEAKTHKWDAGVVTAPTCESEGYTLYTCENDPSHTKTDNTVPKLGHDFGDWEQTKEATCAENGEEKRVCKRDHSHVEINVIPATDHKWDAGAVTAPTCESDGYTLYTCENDPSHTKTDNTVPKLGHDFGDWEQTKEATFTEAGEEKRVCKNDSTHFEIRELPKKVFIPGDMDFDGTVTVADALDLLRIAAKMKELTEFDITVGDMDADGKITVSDSLLALRIAAGLAD